MTLKGPRTRFENPVDTSLLPADRLTVNWRVREEKVGNGVLIDLLFLAAIPLLPLMLKLLILIGAVIGPIVIFSAFAFLCIGWFVAVIFLHSINARHWCYLACYVASWLLQRYDQGLVTVFGLIFLFILVYVFRLHYVGYCTCAPIPLQVAAQFRKTCDVPAHIVPVPVALDFWQAIRSWVSYNRSEHRLPGLWQSPAGNQLTRMLLTVAVLSHLSLTITNLLAIDSAGLNVVSLLVGYLLVHIAPLAIVLGGLYAYSEPILGKAGGLSLSASLGNYWDQLQGDLSTSSNSIERDSIFLGQVHSDGSPILLPLKTTAAHTWIAGATGAGKTAMLMFLLEQFIHLGYSIACIDLKADTFELWHTLLSKANQQPSQPLPIWHFTNRNGWATQFCSPFSQSCWKQLSPGERTNVMLSGMGIGTKRDYGESWYTDATYAVLDFVNRKYPDVKSYSELNERINYELAHARSDELSKAVKKDGEQAALVIRRLSHVEMLNPNSNHSQAARDAGFDFGTLFNQQSLAFWGLNPLVAPIDSAEISRVVLGTLLATATSMQLRKRNVLLVIDEFQQMLAPGVLQLALRQARSLGISVILLNQTVDDLKSNKNNFVPTVEGNTATQIWLNASGRDAIDQIQRLGGKLIDYVYTETTDAQGRRTIAKQEILVDRYDATTIAHASSQRNAFITRISINDGYIQHQGIPFVARAEYHLSHAEYQKRSLGKWPTLTSRSVIVGQRGLPPAGHSPIVNNTPAPSPAPVLNARKSRNIISGATIGKRTP